MNKKVKDKEYIWKANGKNKVKGLNK